MLHVEKHFIVGDDRLKTIKVKGDYKKLNNYLERLLEIAKMGTLNQYGEAGIRALRAATPLYTGETADAWSYSIERKDNSVALVFNNSNTEFGVNVAILLQYDHFNTKMGGIIKGIDYINPALKPIFENIADNLWKEVINA